MKIILNYYDAETFEKDLKKFSNVHKGEIQKIVMNSLNDKNNFYVMINSGSKGGSINAMQIMGSLGQDIWGLIEFRKNFTKQNFASFF